MKVKDIMIPLREYLKPDYTLREAVRIMKTATRNEKRKGVKGLPVLDDAGNLTGMLSMTDILRSVYPSYLSSANLGDFTWDGMVESLAREAAGEKVEYHMNREILTVRESDSLMDCVDHLLKNCVTRLPVLNQEGRITGLIYERDVFEAVVEAMLESEKEGEKS